MKTLISVSLYKFIYKDGCLCLLSYTIILSFEKWNTHTPDTSNSTSQWNYSQNKQPQHVRIKVWTYAVKTRVLSFECWWILCKNGRGLLFAHYVT